MEDNEGVGAHGKLILLPYGGQRFDLAGFPAGYRFMPTDVELIGYLAAKLGGQSSSYTFKEIDLYSCTPEELEVEYGARRENEMYFFSKASLKFSMGERRNRKAREGVWRDSSSKRPITDHNGHLIGQRMQLNYRNKTNPKRNTEWLMHEYSIPSNSDKINEYVLCKVYKKLDNKKKLQIDAPMGEPRDVLMLQLQPNHIANVDDQQNLEHQIPQTNLDQPQQQDLAAENQNLQPQASQDMVIEDQGNMRTQIQQNYPNHLPQQHLAYEDQKYQPQLPFQNMEIEDHANMSQQIPQTVSNHLQVQQQVHACEDQKYQPQLPFMNMEIEDHANMSQQIPQTVSNHLQVQQQVHACEDQKYQPQSPFKNMEIEDHANMSQQIPQTFSNHLQVQQQVPAYEDQNVQLLSDQNTTLNQFANECFTREELAGFMPTNQNADLSQISNGFFFTEELENYYLTEEELAAVGIDPMANYLQVQQQVPAYDSQNKQISNDFISTEELSGNRNGDLMTENEYVVPQAESTNQAANI